MDAYSEVVPGTSRHQSSGYRRYQPGNGLTRAPLSSSRQYASAVHRSAVLPGLYIRASIDPVDYLVIVRSMPRPSTFSHAHRVSSSTYKYRGPANLQGSVQFIPHPVTWASIHTSPRLHTPLYPYLSSEASPPSNPSITLFTCVDAHLFVTRLFTIFSTSSLTFSRSSPQTHKKSFSSFAHLY